MKGFKGEIENDEKILVEHSKDASVFKVIPSAVWYPKDVEDIQIAIKSVSEEKRDNPEISLSVRAGGTCMSGGSLNTGYILNMTKHMNKIEIDPEKKIAVVEMGAYFRDIESEAAKHGLMFAPYTSSHLICGIGGMIGNNASGEKSIRYGATIDNIIDLEVVLADGTLLKTAASELHNISGDKEKALLELYDEYGIRLKEAVGLVPKAASGYRLERVVKDGIFDMSSIFVGAQGTLGIITKATLKLVPIPQFTRLMIISIDSIHDLPFILKTVLKHNPEGVETFDINTYNRAHLLLPTEAEFFKKFIHPTTSLVVLVQFSEETQEATDNQMLTCEQELTSHNISFADASEKEVSESAWKIRRSSYTLMRDYNEDGFRAVPCIEDVIVPVAYFDAFIEELVELSRKHSINYGFHGHIGDGALRIIPVFDFKNENVADKIIAFMQDVFALVKKLRGNTSADHSDGIIRTPFLEEFYGADIYEAFVKIKKLFDPEGIFNPKKKVGGTKEMIRQWLDR